MKKTWKSLPDNEKLIITNNSQDYPNTLGHEKFIKRTQNPYLLWCNENRVKVTEHYPNVTDSKEISKLVSIVVGVESINSQ